ncbi:MAG: AbrB/MazE/SpoVT family DNA-binding domain-containing protein [Chloroflexi bacterium]|nr:AbrB/MazE/SpoVT family DNA-binding domain-containing protein [Chloroflexota bacterium]
MHIQLRTRGRITIPISIRRGLGIKKGTRIHFEIDETARRIVVTPITREYVQHSRGKYKGKGLLKALMDEKRTESEY